MCKVTWSKRLINFIRNGIRKVVSGSVNSFKDSSEKPARSGALEIPPVGWASQEVATDTEHPIFEEVSHMGEDEVECKSHIEPYEDENEYIQFCYKCGQWGESCYCHEGSEKNASSDDFVYLLWCHECGEDEESCLCKNSQDKKQI